MRIQELFYQQYNMEKIVSVKTITEVLVSNNTFNIKSFSDTNPDNTTTPELFKSQVLNVAKEIDNEKGVEGDLILSYYGSKVGDINSNGILILDVENDNLNKYNIDSSNGELIYD